RVAGVRGPQLAGEIVEAGVAPVVDDGAAVHVRQLGAVDADLARGDDADLDATAPDVEDAHLDVVADAERLAGVSTQHQHRRPPRRPPRLDRADAAWGSRCRAARPVCRAGFGDESRSARTGCTSPRSEPPVG